MRNRFFLLVLVAAMLGRGTVQALWPRIVNGVATDQYPAVALVAFYSDATQSELAGLCSGALVGCHTVLTAGHCVCPDSADNYESCVAEGLADPGSIAVFLANVGVLPVRRVTLHPGYEFGNGNDVSILELTEPAEGVPVLPLVTAKPADGSSGRVVGYGTTRSGFRSVDDTGIKREGLVVFGACPSDVPADGNLCWNFTGSGANACSGDSGGAVVVQEGGRAVLAGVVSGGSTFDCQPPDQSFATSIAAVRNWLVATGGSDVGASCALPGSFGDGLVETYSVELTAARPRAQVEFDVPVRAAELRVTFNGQSGSGTGLGAVDNDFDLFLAPVEAASREQWVCQDERAENWGACRVPRPDAGRWRWELRRVVGSGPAQVTVTIFPGLPSCAGDCNRDGRVEVNELVAAVNILLGISSLENCSAADANRDGEVTVDEILLGVNAALAGCEAVATTK